MRPSKTAVRSLAAFTVAFLIGAFVIAQIEISREHKDDERLEAIGSNYANQIEDHLEHSLSSTFALASLIKQGDGNVADFDEIAARIMQTYGGITNVQLAPRGVVQNIYPLKGNEAAIGHDLLADPKRRTEAMATIESRKLTLAGPFELVQGGEAVIGRLPVFTEQENGGERFWGFASVLVEMSQFIREIDLARMSDEGYDFELWRHKPDTGERHVFAGSRKTQLRDPVDVDLFLLDSKWVLSIVRQADKEPPYLRYMGNIAIILIFSGLVGFSAYVTLRQSDVLSREVGLRTDELQKLNTVLRDDVTAREKAKELSDALNEINAAANEDFDLERFFQMVVERAALALKADHAIITSNEDEKIIIRNVYNYPSALIGTGMAAKDAPEIALAQRSTGPIVISDASQDDRVSTKTIAGSSIKSLAVLPLISHDIPVGAVALYFQKARKLFSDDEIVFARQLSAALSLVVANNELYASQNEILRTLQRALLDVPDEVAGIDFGHFYHSATVKAEVGGDFYEVFELARGKLGIAIGDVSGHGISAAKVASLVKNTLKAFCVSGKTPAETLRRSNDILLEQTESAVFVTAFLGVLDPADGQFVYCNAGHPPPMIRKEGGAVELLNPRSPALGVLKESKYEEELVNVDASDVCVLYTDGVIEARKNGDQFGEERLIELLGSVDTADVSKLPETVVQAILSFTGDIIKDDVAILAFVRHLDT